MKILVVAPETDDLPNIDAELAFIMENPKLELVPDPPLVGYVTSKDIAHAVNKTKCDVIIFMAHGDDDGITLSNGERLAANLLVQHVKRSGASLCVLNTCWGEKLAWRIFWRCRIDVIYAVEEIADSDAAIYMSYLAEALASTNGDYAEAFRLSAPQAGIYKRLAVNQPGTYMSRAFTYDNPDEVIGEMKHEVERMVDIIDGDAKIGLSGVRDRLEKLQSTIIELDGARKKAEWQQASIDRRLTNLGYAVIAIAVMNASTLIIVVIQVFSK